jgi:putative spermidine/putrescine transport system substrate-binding protein
VPVALAKPDTGWIHIKSTMHIVKNSKNVDLAAAYINAALSPEVQTKMAEAPYFIAPTSKFNRVDWAKLNPRRAAMIERFNREIRV